MDNMEKSVSKVIAKSMLEEEGKCSIIDTNKAQRRTGDHGVTQPTDYAGGIGDRFPADVLQLVGT